MSETTTQYGGGVMHMVNKKKSIIEWKGCKTTWEECSSRFACQDGEECWFDSEDYKKNSGL
jgi:hypothetical protein